MYDLCTERRQRGTEKVQCQNQTEKQNRKKEDCVFSTSTPGSAFEELTFIILLYCHFIA